MAGSIVFNTSETISATPYDVTTRIPRHHSDLDGAERILNALKNATTAPDKITFAFDPLARLYHKPVLAFRLGHQTAVAIIQDWPTTGPINAVMQRAAQNPNGYSLFSMSVADLGPMETEYLTTLSSNDAVIMHFPQAGITLDLITSLEIAEKVQDAALWRNTADFFFNLLCTAPVPGSMTAEPQLRMIEGLPLRMRTDIMWQGRPPIVADRTISRFAATPLGISGLNNVRAMRDGFEQEAPTPAEPMPSPRIPNPWDGIMLGAGIFVRDLFRKNGGGRSALADILEMNLETGLPLGLHTSRVEFPDYNQVNVTLPVDTPAIMQFCRGNRAISTTPQYSPHRVDVYDPEWAETQLMLRYDPATQRLTVTHYNPSGESLIKSPDALLAVLGQNETEVSLPAKPFQDITIQTGGTTLRIKMEIEAPRTVPVKRITLDTLEYILSQFAILEGVPKFTTTKIDGHYTYDAVVQDSQHNTLRVVVPKTFGLDTAMRVIESTYHLFNVFSRGTQQPTIQLTVAFAGPGMIDSILARTTHSMMGGVQARENGLIMADYNPFSPELSAHTPINDLGVASTLPNRAIESNSNFPIQIHLLLPEKGDTPEIVERQLRTVQDIMKLQLPILAPLLVPEVVENGH